MPTADQIPERWSAIAPAYESAFEPFSKQFAAETLRLLDLSPEDRVLDVAAGTGAFSLPAARLGCEVLAVDFAAGMVDRLRHRAAQEGLARLRTAVMDGQALALADGSYDVAVSILGLMLFPDLAKGLTELRRVLRSGGRGAVVCWVEVRELRLMTVLMQAIKRVVPDFAAPPTPSFARMAGRSSVREFMQRAGFADVIVTGASGTMRIASPEAFWTGFTSSAPPVADLLARLGADRTAEVGRVYLDLLREGSDEGAPTLRAEACIGIGRV